MEKKSLVRGLKLGQQVACVRIKKVLHAVEAGGVNEVTSGAQLLCAVWGGG